MTDSRVGCIIEIWQCGELIATGVITAVSDDGLVHYRTGRRFGDTIAGRRFGDDTIAIPPVAGSGLEVRIAEPGMTTEGINGRLLRGSFAMPFTWPEHKPLAVQPPAGSLGAVQIQHNHLNAALPGMCECSCLASSADVPRRSEAVQAKPQLPDRAQELLAAESRKIRELGEAGYESPYYIWLRGGDPGAAEEYWAWRRARTEYVVHPTPENLERMLDQVTMENPPLASDILREPDGASGDVRRIIAAVVALAAIMFSVAAICIGI